MKTEENSKTRNRSESAENAFGFDRFDNGGMLFLTDRDGGDDPFAAEKAVADFKRKAISAVTALDLPPAAKQTVLDALAALKK